MNRPSKVSDNILSIVLKG